MVNNLVKRGDWLAKIDLNDVYFLVPVLPSHPSSDKQSGSISILYREVKSVTTKWWSYQCKSGRS